jgi:hypothetical protein
MNPMMDDMSESNERPDLFRELVGMLVITEIGRNRQPFGRCRVCWATTKYGLNRHDVMHEPDCPVAAALARAAELERSWS